MPPQCVQLRKPERLRKLFRRPTKEETQVEGKLNPLYKYKGMGILNSFFNNIFVLITVVLLLLSGELAKGKVLRQ